MVDRDPRGRDPGAGEYGEGRRGENGKGDRSLPALFGDLTRELTTLLKQEVALARAEVSEKVSQAGRGVTSALVGATVAFLGLQVVLAGIVLLLAQAMDPWAAALLVGLVVAGVGAAMLMKAKKALQPSKLAPKLTQESIREDIQVVKERIQ